jgi:hypothetical protein
MCRGIGERIDDLELLDEAVRDEDLAGIRADHDPEILMFDVPPPFLSRGINAAFVAWRGCVLPAIAHCLSSRRARGSRLCALLVMVQPYEMRFIPQN